MDEDPELATKFGVQAIPLLALLKDGQEVNRVVGVHSAGALQEMIQRAL